MNREKLRELRRQFSKTALVGMVIDALLEDDEQAPGVDRSLRGWVHVTDKDGNQWIGLASKDGVRSDSRRDYGIGYQWDDLVDQDITVRPLTPEDIGFRVRKWLELSRGEREEWRKGGESFDHAIDIATRRTP